MTRREEHKRTAQALTGAAATFIAGASCGYANLFSPWGLHNVGVMALVAAVFATSSALRMAQSENGRPRWMGAAAAQVCAIYAYYTNIFLLPVATVAALVMSPNLDRRRRVILIATYGAMLLLFALPEIPLLSLKPEDTPSLTVVGDLAQLSIRPTLAGYTGPPQQLALHALALRALGWISAGSRYFSLPGLVLGVIGAGILCVRHEVWMPLLIIGAHWLAWTVMPGFSWNGSPSDLRTYNYVLPFLWLGIGVDVAFVLYGLRPGARRTVTIAATVLLVIHLTMQLPLFGSSARIASRLPVFYNSYLCGQGRLHRIVSDMDSRVPSGATIVVWDTPMQNVYYVLSSHRESGIVLKTLWERQKGLTLSEHLRKYGSSVDCNSLYALAPPEQQLKDVGKAADAVLGRDGFQCSPPYLLQQIVAYPAGPKCDFLGDLVLSRLTPIPK
jgi:hypothetical protein